MTVDSCVTCATTITTLYKDWVHIDPAAPTDHPPRPKGWKDPYLPGSDRYGPRFNRPGSPIQLPPDFYDRRA